MVEVYSKPKCQACENTKGKMRRLGIEFQEKDLYDSPEILEEAKERGFLSAPIVVANGIMWSGHDEEKIEALIPEEDTWNF